MYWFEGSSTMHTGPRSNRIRIVRRIWNKQQRSVRLNIERRNRTVRSGRIRRRLVRHIQILILAVHQRVDRIRCRRQILRRAARDRIQRARGPSYRKWQYLAWTVRVRRTCIGDIDRGSARNDRCRTRRSRVDCRVCRQGQLPTPTRGIREHRLIRVID